MRVRTPAGDIWVTVDRGDSGRQLRVLIDAPAEFQVMREELLPPSEWHGAGDAASP